MQFSNSSKQQYKSYKTNHSEQKLNATKHFDTH